MDAFEVHNREPSIPVVVHAPHGGTWIPERGAEVGRITRTWEGLAKTLFTTADDYLLGISPSLSAPLRLLAFPSAVGVDTALKQDSRGLG